MTGFGSQLSVAVGFVAVGMALQLTVTFAGTPTNWGAKGSVTVMVWTKLVVFKHKSTAVQVLLMV